MILNILNKSRRITTDAGWINLVKEQAGPIPVTARSKARVCGRPLAGIVGSKPAGAWMSVYCECCVLSGTGPCPVLITHLEESYRVWCVSSVIMKPRQWGPGPLWAIGSWGGRKKTGPLAESCQYDINPSASKHSREISCMGEKLSASQ